MKSKDSKSTFEIYSRVSDEWLVKPCFSGSSMQIVEVRSGAVRIQAGTEYICAEQGDFVFVPSGLMFSAHAEEGEASVRAILFDKAIIEENIVNYETEILHMFYIQSENKVKLFDAQHPTYPILSRCMNDSYDEYLLKDVCFKLPVRANIYLMMSALLRYYCGSKNEADKIIYHNVLRLKPVIAYIAERFSDKLRIETLADKIMVSADYFTKMFKDSIGKTPVDYINGIRVNKAMQLLIDTNLSMTEISESVGFCNANYFHKIFKQYMGISPLAYRKIVK